MRKSERELYFLARLTITSGGGKASTESLAPYLPGRKHEHRAPFVSPPWADSMGRASSPEPTGAVARWPLQTPCASLELLTSEHGHHQNQRHVSQASPWPSGRSTNTHVRLFLAGSPATELRVWALRHSEHISGEFFNILHLLQPERWWCMRRVSIPPLESPSLHHCRHYNYPTSHSALEMESPSISPSLLIS